MHKTKLALVGAGTIGQRHLKAMSQVEEAELTAIVDNQPQAESIAVEMNVPFFHTTEEMLRTQIPVSECGASLRLYERRERSFPRLWTRLEVDYQRSPLVLLPQPET